MRWFKIAGEKLNKNVPYQAGSKTQLDSALLEAGGSGIDYHCAQDYLHFDILAFFACLTARLSQYK